ncbi:MAG: MaoC family dehydratase N-terminal domain-containing protein [Pseudomonadota bacterium]
MDLQDYIGKPTGAGKVHVERGAVSRFAHALTDENPIYHDTDAAQVAGFEAPPVTPTWTFASAFLGTYPEDQPEDVTAGQGSPMMKIIGELMQEGGLILHGEQEFRYHLAPQCGDVLDWSGEITDIYTRESKGKIMTFIVTETVYKNAVGEPVVTEIFNLIHRK